MTTEAPVHRACADFALTLNVHICNAINVRAIWHLSPAAILFSLPSSAAHSPIKILV